LKLDAKRCKSLTTWIPSLQAPSQQRLPHPRSIHDDPSSNDEALRNGHVRSAGLGRDVVKLVVAAMQRHFGKT
jgi:hypothetical protein